MSLHRAALAFALVLPACGSTSDGAEDTDGSSGTSGSDTSAGPSGTSESPTTNPSGSTSGEPGTTTVDPTTTTGDPPSTETSSGETTGEPTPADTACPETLPAEWILCEDFEGKPGWGDFWTNEGAMAVEPGPASSGESSLRISHNVGQYGSGMADLRFGAGPNGGTIYEPDAEFREVWVRFYLRTHEDWPAGAGISEGIEVMSVVGGNRSIAVDASIYSTDTAEARFLPWSCVHDSELRCSSGNGDWNNPDLRPLANELGPTPIYGNERAGAWQCHEMHVRLDEPGQADGLLEFWIDEELEISLDGLEYVGSWDGAGLNNVRFGSFWNEQTGLDHHVDDVVVSTAPIGCPSVQ